MSSKNISQYPTCFIRIVYLSEDFIRTIAPYLFTFLSLAVVGFWSSIDQKKIPSRTPAALDCQQLVKEITQSNDESQAKGSSLFKFRNKIWNKIITNKEFEHFKDNEYLKWQEIYKDSQNELTSLNPVTLEQKLALIEVINAKTLVAIEKQTPSLKFDIQKLSALKLKKLSNHLEKMDLTSKLTRDELEDFAADLFIILKGPPVSLMDYFTANKSKLMNRRIFRTVQEDMLVMGLKGMLERIPEKTNYSRLEDGKYLLKNFFQLKIWKYMVIPYDLPWFEKLNIPTELLEKILLEGLSKHNEELITHLKSQNMIDHYERFRKVYRPVAFSIGFIFYYDKFGDKYKDLIKSNQDEEKKELKDAFKNIGQVINDNYNEEKDDDINLKNEQFNRLVESFKKEYGEITPEELEDLKMKVYGTKN